MGSIKHLQNDRRHAIIKSSSLPFLVIFASFLVAARLDFEIEAYVYGEVWGSMIFDLIMMGIVVVYCASIFLFFFSATKRKLANAMIYLAILLLPLPIYWSQRVVQSSFMIGKAYLFHFAPQLCQDHKKGPHGYFVCYQYEVEGGKYGGDAIVFDPDRQMSLPPETWPAYMIQPFYDPRFVKEDGNYCSVRDTKRIIADVYWVSKPAAFGGGC